MCDRGEIKCGDGRDFRQIFQLRSAVGRFLDVVDICGFGTSKFGENNL